jgi:hypothetical protein
MVRKYNKSLKTERRKKKYLNPCYNTEDIYKFYMSNIKNDSYKLSLKEFKEIVHEYNKVLAHLMIEDSQIIRLPFRMGELGIMKRKQNYEYQRLDYGHYNKTGEKRYHTNLHSNRWIAKLYWIKKNCIVKNKKYYSFTETSSIKKRLGQIMLKPEGYKKYFEA